MPEPRAPEPPKSPASSPRSAFWLRLGAAHLLAYPPAFAAAFAGVPLAMIVREGAVLAAPSETIAQRLVLEVCGVTALLVYGLIHVIAVPWSRAAADSMRGKAEAEGRQARAFKLFVAATLALAFVSVVGALVGWAWLLTV